MLDLQSFKGFTAGPWRATRDKSGFPVVLAQYAIATPSFCGVRLGELRGNMEKAAEIKANTELLAAAPDLLSLAIKQEAEIKRLKAALAKLDDMIVTWARDEGFPPENSACLRVVREAMEPAHA